MLKWILLALGVFLFTNGMLIRTFSFADPERHCFYIDLVGVNGCFGTPVLPLVVVWSSWIGGGALILGCLLYVRAQRSRRKT